MHNKTKILGSLAVASCLTLAAFAQSDNSTPTSSPPATPSSVPSNQAVTPTDGSDQKTPMDQGSCDRDVEITKKIRQQIVAMDSLSTNAKNVKIITKNGHVTLRGVVNSSDEQKTITGIAGKVAGATNVVNKLTLKANT